MAIWFALLAAASFAISSVLQQRAAEAVDARHALRPSLFGRLFRDGRWWAGRFVEVVALVCQTLALARGTLLAVQPVLATGLLMALPLHAALTHRRLGRRELVGALLVTAGLAVFLLGGRPQESAVSPESWSRWVAAFAVVGGVAGGLVVLGWRSARPGVRAAAWAAAGAAVYALSGGLLKGVTEVWQNHGVLACFFDLRLYGFLLVGALGTLVIQSAFQAAPLPSSIASLTAAEPVAAAAVGFMVFGETLHAGAGALSAALVGAVAMAVGTIVVAHSPLLAGSAPVHAEPEDPVGVGVDVAGGVVTQVADPATTSPVIRRIRRMPRRIDVESL